MDSLGKMNGTQGQTGDDNEDMHENGRKVQPLSHHAISSSTALDAFSFCASKDWLLFVRYSASMATKIIVAR